MAFCLHLSPYLWPISSSSLLNPRVRVQPSWWPSDKPRHPQRKTKYRREKKETGPSWTPPPLQHPPYPPKKLPTSFCNFPCGRLKTGTSEQGFLLAPSAFLMVDSKLASPGIPEPLQAPTLASSQLLILRSLFSSSSSPASGIFSPAYPLSLPVPVVSQKYLHSCRDI